MGWHIHVFVRVGLVDIHRKLVPNILSHLGRCFAGHLHKFLPSPSVEVSFPHATRARNWNLGRKSGSF
jgi:hypothetical protein